MHVVVVKEAEAKASKLSEQSIIHIVTGRADVNKSVFFVFFLRREKERGKNWRKILFFLFFTFGA